MVELGFEIILLFFGYYVLNYFILFRYFWKIVRLLVRLFICCSIRVFKDILIESYFLIVKVFFV